VTYLWHYGRCSEAVIKKVEEELKLLYAAIKKTFREEYLTHKVHVMQHIPHFMRMHGSGSWTDGWNMERLNLYTRNLTNATTNELGTIVRNFIIKYHGSVFQNVNSFQPQVQKQLHHLGVDTTLFGYHFGDKLRKEHDVQSVPSHLKNLVMQEILKEKISSRQFAEMYMRRVVSMNRKGVILESKEAWHPPDSKVRNSYIQVHGSIFGQIDEIFMTKEENAPYNEKFIFILYKFTKIRTRIENDVGAEIQFPINQFPYEIPPHSSSNYYVFLLKDHTFIQKAHIGQLRYPKHAHDTKLFTVNPNGDFHS